jgi:hypothetical protein
VVRNKTLSNQAPSKSGREGGGGKGKHQQNPGRGRGRIQERGAHSQTKNTPSIETLPATSIFFSTPECHTKICQEQNNPSFNQRYFHYRSLVFQQLHQQHEKERNTQPRSKQSTTTIHQIAGQTESNGTRVRSLGVQE